jgi:hypothetical protein
MIIAGVVATIIGLALIALIIVNLRKGGQAIDEAVSESPLAEAPPPQAERKPEPRLELVKPPRPSHGQERGAAGAKERQEGQASEDSPALALPCVDDANRESMGKRRQAVASGTFYLGLGGLV